MTSALRKTDMKAIGLQMALDLLHKKENRDLITGLKTRTQTGRPDWEKVSQLSSNTVEPLYKDTYPEMRIFSLIRITMHSPSYIEKCTKLPLK